MFFYPGYIFSNCIHAPYIGYSWSYDIQHAGFESPLLPPTLQGEWPKGQDTCHRCGSMLPYIVYSLTFDPLRPVRCHFMNRISKFYRRHPILSNHYF